MFATVRIPDFRLAAVLRRMEEPPPPPRAVALVEGRRSIIAAADAAARRKGVSVGMTSARALGRCPGLAVFPADPSAELSACSWLRALASSVSPAVEVFPEGAVAGLAGAGDPARAGKKLLSLCRGEMEVCVGISDTIERSFWVSLRADPLRIAVREEDIFGGFAIEDAPLPEAVFRCLADWGLPDLLSFVQLPREAVARRLGPEGASLWDGMKGRRARLLRAEAEPVRFRAAFEMEQDVETLDQALFILRRLLGEVCAALRAAVRTAAVLRLRWRMSDGGTGGRDFLVPEPTARIEPLFAMAESYLSGVRTSAPLSFFEVEALPGESGGAQEDFFEIAARDPFRFQEVVGRVCGLLGEGGFGVPVRLPTCHPDGFRMDPPAVRVAVEEDASSFGKRSGPALRRFRPPRPARVRCRDGKPVHCSCREGEGPVLQSRGPFRRSGDWWDPDLRWSREEWDVEWPREGVFRRLVRYAEDRWEWDGLYD